MKDYLKSALKKLRHWLAITNDLPIKDWYFDNTSIWTLDYPPFFAYFQWLLAQAAVLVDPAMTKVENLNYSSTATIMFLRCSVIVVDALLILASWLYISKLDSLKKEEMLSTFCLVIFNAGLLLVDHIHFQFNGMLMGVLIFCIYFAHTKRYLRLTVCFSVLVLMKHLFVPLAPIFGVFLIQKHCFVADSKPSASVHSRPSFSVIKFLQLVAIAGIALVLAFVPFLLQSNGREQLPQIFSRLFPFGRGLVHAYWAPNIWSLYCFADKVGFSLLNKFPVLQRFLPFPMPSVASMESIVVASASAVVGSTLSHGGVSSSSAGLIGDFLFLLLPHVTATHCMLLLLLSLLPALWVVWYRPSVPTLLHALVYASMSSFMVGYHVHEKAIIIPWLLQTFVCMETQQNKVLFLVLSGAGCLGLFPLFTGLPELFVKATLLVSYQLASWFALSEISTPLSKWNKRVVLLSWSILAGVFIFAEIIHPIAFVKSTGTDGSKELYLPFLPLMVASVVCAVQLVGCWLLSLQVMLQSKL